MIANDGAYVAPRLVSATVGPDGEFARRRTVGDPTGGQRADRRPQMQSMMRDVVCTAPPRRRGSPAGRSPARPEPAYKAQADGTYFNADGVTHDYYSSFVGFFPAEDPQVTVLISIDEPKTGFNSRGPVGRPGVPHARADDHPRAGDRAAARFHRLRWRLSRHVTTGDPDASRAARRAPRPARRSSTATRRSPCRRSPTTRARSEPAGCTPACAASTTTGTRSPRRGRRRRSSPARRPPRAPTSAVAQLIVDDTRLALGPIAAAVHGDPSTALRVVGITGTNGKTTTSMLVAAILRAAGDPTSVIGTLSGAVHDAGGPRPAGPPGRAPRRGAPVGGDGGVVARARPAPCRRHAVRRRRLHQPRPRPPRPARHRRGVLPGQGAAVPAGLAVVGVVNVDDAHGRLPRRARRSRWSRSASPT